jgi:hypothetical protein
LGGLNDLILAFKTLKNSPEMPVRVLFRYTKIIVKENPDYSEKLLSTKKLNFLFEILESETSTSETCTNILLVLATLSLHKKNNPIIVDNNICILVAKVLNKFSNNELLVEASFQLISHLSHENEHISKMFYQSDICCVITMTLSKYVYYVEFRKLVFLGCRAISVICLHKKARQTFVLHGACDCLLNILLNFEIKEKDETILFLNALLTIAFDDAGLEILSKSFIQTNWAIKKLISIIVYMGQENELIMTVGCRLIALMANTAKHYMYLININVYQRMSCLQLQLSKQNRDMLKIFYFK